MTNTTTHNLAAASGRLLIGGDLEVYRLGFGAMRITGDGIWGPPRDHDEAIRVLRRAIDLGVNLIDTADAYGPNVSEELIAEALYPYPEDLVIATKGGLERTGPGQWPPNGRPEHLRAALEGSLRRLRLDCIDVYQLHRPDPKVPFEESVGTIADLQKQGKIRHVGLSNVSVAQLKSAQSMLPIVTVQNMYNLATRDSEDVLDACESQSIGFIPWAPLESGQGTSRGGVVQRIAEAHNITPGSVALAWLLQRSPVMLPIPGTSSVAHLEQNMQAATIQLSDQEFEELDRA
jgi:pyridoxine 4-dehydrogenase